MAKRIAVELTEVELRAILAAVAASASVGSLATGVLRLDAALRDIRDHGVSLAPDALE